MPVYNTTFYNPNDTIGIILTSSTATTGDIFISLVMIVGILLAICMLFGIKMEYTAIIILPLLLSLMGVSGRFVAAGGVLLIYLALLVTKNFIFNR